MTVPQQNDPTKAIISAAIEVHRAIGPGLLESVYEECLCSELRFRSIRFDRQVSLPLVYRDVRLECGFLLDIVVDRRVVVELKATEKLTPIHEAQMLTYLRLSKLTLGLLINFNHQTLKEGLRRSVL